MVLLRTVYFLREFVWFCDAKGKRGVKNLAKSRNVIYGRTHTRILNCMLFCIQDLENVKQNSKRLRTRSLCFISNTFKGEQFVFNPSQDFLFTPFYWHQLDIFSVFWVKFLFLPFIFLLLVIKVKDVLFMFIYGETYKEETFQLMIFNDDNLRS